MSVSGGEPLQQPEALLDLVERVRGAGFSVIIFTGYTLAAVRAMPLGSAILAHADALVAGPYVAARHEGRALCGSSNQRVHLLSRRYADSDFEAVPAAEAVLHEDGTVTLSGIRPIRVDGSQRRP